MQSRWLYSPIFAKSRSELDIKANGKPDVNGTGPWKALCFNSQLQQLYCQHHSQSRPWLLLIEIVGIEMLEVRVELISL